MKNICFLAFISVSFLFSFCGSPSNDNKKQSIKIGDSLFVGDAKYDGIKIGKIGRIPISRNEIERLHGVREDTVGFKSGSIGADRKLNLCFIKSRSTYLGKCLSLDTIQEEYGSVYLIRFTPSACIKEAIERESYYGIETEDGTYYIETKNVFGNNQLM